jgi:hypothetical protein
MVALLTLGLEDRRDILAEGHRLRRIIGGERRERRKKRAPDRKRQQARVTRETAEPTFPPGARHNGLLQATPASFNTHARVVPTVHQNVRQPPL